MGVSSMQNPVCQRFSEVFRSLCQMWTIKIKICPAFQAAKKALCEVPPVRLQCTGGKNPKCTLAKWMHRCGVWGYFLPKFVWGILRCPLVILAFLEMIQGNGTSLELKLSKGKGENWFKKHQERTQNRTSFLISSYIIIYNHIIYIVTYNHI